ncbi:MAG: hypothetical protein ABI321_10645 [Polyangia bacterium]
MGQPVKLSSQLVTDARVAGEIEERSLAGQIELWARLGRALEPFLRTHELMRLKQRGDAVPLTERLADIDTDAGRRRTAAYAATRPFPHFEPHERHGYLVKIDEDGTRTVGRFVKRTWTPLRKR